MQRFVVNTECAIEYAGKFLMIRRPDDKPAGGMLAFPGGKFELEDGAGTHDALQQGARREVLEEVGLQLEAPLRYVTSRCFQVPENGLWVVNVLFHVVLESDPGELDVSPTEVPEHAWLSRSEVEAADNCPPWLPDYLVCV